MAKYKSNNEQTTVFRIVNSKNKTLAYINLNDELNEDDYAFFEKNMVKLVQTKQVDIMSSVLGGIDDDDLTSEFKI